MITPYRFRSVPGSPSVGEYLPLLSGGATFLSTRLLGETPVPIPCVLSNIILRMTAPGGVTAREFQLQVNAVTVATWTLSGSSNEIRDTNEYNLTTDDLVTVVYSAQTGSPAALGDVLSAFEITTSSPHQNKSLYWSSALTFDTVQPRFHNAFDSGSADSNAWSSGTTGGTRMAICPIEGAIVGYYTRIRTGGTAFNGTILINKNNVAQDGTGGTVDTTQPWSASQIANTTHNRFTEFDLPLFPGDRVVFKETRTSGSTVSGHMCVVFEATTEGESICAMGSNQSAGATNAANYTSPSNADETGWVGTNDSSVEVMGNITTFRLDQMRVGLATLPGTGNTRNLAAHLNNVDTAIAVSITDADTTDATPLACAKADVTNAIDIVDGDRWSIVTTGVSTPAASVIDVAFRQFIEPPPDPVQEVAFFGVEVFTDEDDEEPEDDPGECTGGGTLAAGTNPAAGTDLDDATQPLVWMELTVGATTYRWAKTSIPHGSPKTARVMTFGVIERALSDIDGRAEAGRVSSTLQDIDGTLRALWVNGTLRGVVVDYYCADLATIRAGGTPWRMFRGQIDKCEPVTDRLFRIDVEDIFTARTRFIDADDLMVPSQLVTEDISDQDPLQQMFGRPVPDIYGDVYWQFEYIGQGVAAGYESLGSLSWFLVGLGVIGVRTVEGSSLGGSPNARVPFSPAAYGSTIFVPGHTGWIEADIWSERGGRRYTLIAGRTANSAVKLARQGTIPFVGHVCGYDTIGDRSGSPVTTITSPARAYGHWLNNRVLQDATADWLPILTEGGISLIDTDTIEAVAAYQESSAYEAPYRIDGVIGHDFQQRSSSDVEAEFCRTFGFDVGINRHGQRMVVALDQSQSFNDAPIITEAHILAHSVQHSSLPVENVIRFVYDRNYLTALPEETPDTGRRLPNDPYTGLWNSGEQKVQSDACITALGGGVRGIRRSQVQEFGLIADEGTAVSSAMWRRDLLAVPNGRLEPSFDLSLRHGYVFELGDVLQAQHWDLPWTGTRKAQVRRLRTDLDALTVRPTVRDVDDLVVVTG